ncbi:c-type cytochrome [Flavobacterium sp. GCM10027622]|uniref:c-type cytochrome n=1 Tax=unclassified Flavobacterium TaxID=196869 RepID=UPI00360E39DC
MTRIFLLFCCFGLFSAYRTSESDYCIPSLVQKQDPQYKRGETLFKRNCASCHAINMKQVMTAPALAGITKKRSMDWLFRYTTDNFKMKQMNDPIALQLSKQGWALMPSFPIFSKRDLQDLYYFIEKKGI